MLEQMQVLINPILNKGREIVLYCYLKIPMNLPSLLKKSIDKRLDIDIGVIIADSMNRPWRLGTVGEAIGCAGIMVLDDRRGETDLFGRELKVTLINRADAIAALRRSLWVRRLKRHRLQLFPVGSRSWEREAEPLR